MITIKHPTVSEGTVEVSGLTFTDGVAEVSNIDDAARAVLTDHGFTFDGDPEDPKSAPVEIGRFDLTEIVGTKLEKLSRAEVDAIAAEFDIDVSGAKNKGEAIALIEASGKIPVVGTVEAHAVVGPADDSPAGDDDQKGADAS